MTTSRLHTLIIGGGQAGLSLSYCLRQRGVPHLVIEQAALPAEAWRNQRWDSFTLVTPNWHIRLPGAPYSGADPDAFLPRAEIVSYFEDWLARTELPVVYGVRATRVATDPGGGYRVTTAGTTYSATNVVIATGTYQRPKIPAFAAGLPPQITQLHTSRYRNPGSLPPGAVLVVGSG